jgi:hypothetical protein
MAQYGAWFPPLDDLYSDRPHADDPRDLFQGDVFADVPCARFPNGDGASIDPVARHRRGLAMVVGHPCDISPGEKGASFPWRTTCAVFQDSDARLTLDGEGHYYAFPLPDLRHDGEVWFADFRFLTTIHESWLTPARWVASLSPVGWYALQRRWIHYFTRVEMHPMDIEDAAVDADGAPLHPDAA